MRESDMLIDQSTLEAKIRRGIEEYEQGKVHRMEEGESVDGFLSRMIWASTKCCSLKSRHTKVEKSFL